MLRIANISPRLVLTRTDDGEVLSRHAFIRAGDKIRAKSSEISYGNIAYSLEVVSYQNKQHVVIRESPRIVLDIAKGSSRERVDVFGENGSHTIVSRKDRIEHERHRRQIDTERRRGSQLEWNERAVIGLLGTNEKRREYKDSGYDVENTAQLVSNIRQFCVGGILSLPEPKDIIKYGDEKFLVEAVTTDVAVASLTLSRDRGSML